MQAREIYMQKYANYALPTLLMSLQFHLQFFCAPFLLLVPVAIISYQVKSFQMSKAAAALALDSGPSPCNGQNL
jgi:hypothetical protein